MGDDPVLTLPQIRRLMLFYGVTIKTRRGPPAATAYWTYRGVEQGWFLPVFKRGASKKHWPWTLSEWTTLARRMTSGEAGWPRHGRDAFSGDNSANELNRF